MVNAVIMSRTGSQSFQLELPDDESPNIWNRLKATDIAQNKAMKEQDEKLMGSQQNKQNKQELLRKKREEANKEEDNKEDNKEDKKEDQMDVERESSDSDEDSDEGSEKCGLDRVCWRNV